jgi:hypothetical protein
LFFATNISRLCRCFTDGGSAKLLVVWQGILQRCCCFTDGSAGSLKCQVQRTGNNLPGY